MTESNSENKKTSFSNNSFTFFKGIIKRWWLFFIVGVVAGIAGIFYASQQKPIYKSTLTFALDEDGSNNMGGFVSLASQFGINIGGGTDIFSGDNILQIMKSRRMIENVLLSVDTFNNKPYTLIEYYLKINGRRNKENKKNDIFFPVELTRNNLSYRQDSLLYNIYNEIKNSHVFAERPDRKLSIYEVNVTSLDEKFTKDFTDRLVSQTNSFYIQIRTKKAKETLDILEQRAAKMKGNLNSSLTDKASIQDVNLNPAFSEAQVPLQKQQTNIQVYGTAYGEMYKNLEIARFQYLNEIPLMQIIDQADYPMQKIKMGKLKTGIIWSVSTCLLLLFIFWIIHVIKYKYPAEGKYSSISNS